MRVIKTIKSKGYYYFKSRQIFLLLIIAILLNSIVLSNNHSTSALTYEDATNVEFTFNPTISVSLSSADLIISNLTPGSASDSNTVTVTVSTNAGWGYYLAATTAGNNLVNSNNSSYMFTNISSNKASLSNFSDNTWGYTYSTDNGTTWVSGDAGSTSTGYNGLPVDGGDDGATGVKLLNPSSYVGSSSVQFKIGAKASGVQASGTYTGAVNFYAVANPEPIPLSNVTCSNPLPGITYMQEFKDSTKKSAAKSAMTTGDQYFLVDNRDNKGYCVSKQADGKIWMTQNLDLDIAGPLTSDNTNLTTSGSGAYSDGYSTSGSTITWTPSSNATTAHTISGTTVSPAFNTSDFTIPEYAEPGERYIYTSGSDSDDTVYNSLSACTNAHSAEECAHYHAGNYYNWTAAIASNASSSYSSQYTTAANSICPAGWRLPKGKTNAYVDTASTREFGELWRAAGVAPSITAYGYATDGFNKIRSNPLFFVRGGYVLYSFIDGQASSGNYWSSTVYSSGAAYTAFFSAPNPQSASISDRYDGLFVRCLAE